MVNPSFRTLLLIQQKLSTTDYSTPVRSTHFRGYHSQYTNESLVYVVITVRIPAVCFQMELRPLLSAMGVITTIRVDQAL
jgi:hypothetical protein